MSARASKVFLFYLTSSELLEFFEDWPSRVSLAILNNAEKERFYLLPQESAEEDLRRLGDAPPLPVFPPVTGMPSINITYAQENELLQKLARRDDLLSQALKISERLAVMEQAAEADERADTPDLERQDRHTRADTAPLAETCDLLTGLLAGFEPQAQSETSGISLFRKGRSARIRVSGALLSAATDEPLVGLIDSEGRRLALLPAARAKAMGLEAPAFALSQRESSEPGREFEIPHGAPGVPPHLLKELPRRGKQQNLALIGALPGALVADLGQIAAQRCRREAAASRLMATATAASWLLTIVVLAGLYWQEPTEVDQEAVSAPPNFHSEEYVQSLLDRLFPNEEPAES